MKKDIIDIVVEKQETITPLRYQHDYGVKLRLSGNYLPEKFFVELANFDTAVLFYTEEEVTAGIEIPIPDELFQSGKDIIGFIVEKTQSYRKTIAVIKIPVEQRSAIE